jgi:ribosomal-protein-serine acetyltransferase
MAKLPDVLQSGDLTLRRWSPDFVDEVLRAVEDSLPELQRWMPWAQSVPSVDALLVVLRDGQLSFDADREWNYVLFDDCETVVGAAGLHDGDTHYPEIGYWVRTRCTGRGYATAAAGTLTEAALTHLADAERVIIRMDVANLASAAVPPKLGFKLLGEEEREVVALSHTGRGYVWGFDRPQPPPGKL